MLRARGSRIDARGVDAGVAEDVGKLGNVLFDMIKRTREQMPQIVRKHLTFQHVCLLAQRFHQSPHVIAADRLAAARDKNAALFNFV